MTTKEIQTLLAIPNSTLNDWEHSQKRGKLLKLLRGLDLEVATHIIDTYKPSIKYALNTRKIKLNKSVFKKDLLWSRPDGSEIEIKNLITIYLYNPNQEDIDTLLRHFGYQRVVALLKKQKNNMHPNDYQEALEQIDYSENPKEFFQIYTLPSVYQMLQHPKKRYIDTLQKQYTPENIYAMAKEYKISYPSLFQIKKMMEYVA